MASPEVTAKEDVTVPKPKKGHRRNFLDYAQDPFADDLYPVVSDKAGTRVAEPEEEEEEKLWTVEAPNWNVMLGAANEWSQTRAIMVTDPVFWRKWNSQLRFIDCNGPTQRFDLSNRYVSGLPRHRKRQGYTLVETSFARLNDNELTDPSGEFRHLRTSKGEWTRRRDLVRHLDRSYVRADAMLASPFLGLRLQAIAMGGELLPQGQSTGHTIQRIFHCWTQSGPGTTGLLPWTRADSTVHSANLAMAVQQSFGRPDTFVENWAKLMHHVTTTTASGDEEDCRWVHLLAAELALLGRKLVLFPSSMDETRRLLHDSLEPVWGHELARDCRDTYLRQLDSALLFLQLAFCDTLVYSLQERTLGTLQKVQDDWVHQWTTRQAMLTPSQLMALAVWMVQAILALLELSRDPHQMVHGSPSLAHFYLVRDDRADVDMYHYTVQEEESAKQKGHSKERRRGRTLHLYLPRVYYNTVPCHLVLGGFDHAQSSRHGSPSPPIPAWDLLFLQRAWIMSLLSGLVDRSMDPKSVPVPTPSTKTTASEPDTSPGLFSRLRGWFSSPPAPAVVQLDPSAPPRAPPRRFDDAEEEEEEEEVPDIEEVEVSAKDEDEEDEEEEKKPSEPDLAHTPSVNRLAEALGLHHWLLTGGDQVASASLEDWESETQRPSRSAPPLAEVTPFEVLRKSNVVRQFFRTAPSNDKLRVHSFQPKILHTNQAPHLQHTLDSLWSSHM